MLGMICADLHNYFTREIHHGTYSITGGKIEPLAFLQEGQYFRIVGSVFNDGVHQYGDALTLTDETFDGSIWAMAVPKDLLELAQEIADWQAKYSGESSGPYTSESWNGYSYTRAVNAQTGQAATWQDIFKRRLNHWRKI